jgi:aspartate kinase
MALLCVVGEHLKDDPTLFPQVVSALGGIACRMVSQSASRRNLTFVLGQPDLARAMTRLHDHFFARVDV